LLQTGCRLALINEGVDKALVFEPDHKQPNLEAILHVNPQSAQV